MPGVMVGSSGELEAQDVCRHVCIWMEVLEVR